MAPLKGHPKGVPCAELAAAGLTEGYFRKTSHIKQKIPHKNPSTAYRRFPSPKGEACFRLLYRDVPVLNR